ncbi:hypothetical protein NHX12_020502 [Muraenolepis orangiensis]|uniref:DH domain-containing protein n=1 Tax=Muraenolepis orangiensis TaxID=630683 RepID=A0A9Q0EUZ7_9TELE|nr:hypothetical protein NHX12_020502 [Muraenolepis orangiensis]
MSTGVKKPPLAPKPKLPGTTAKPPPPPIAPKPGVVAQPPPVAFPWPSPAALKRAKPALAPKPCVSAPPPQTKPHGPPQEHSDGGLHPLDSENGMVSSPRDSVSELDYIVPARCHGALEAEPPRRRLYNGDGGRDACAEVGPRNGNADGHVVVAVTAGEGDGQEEVEVEMEEEEEKGEVEEGRRWTDGFQPKPRDKPQRQKHLARGRTGGEGQGSPEAPPQQLQEQESETEWRPESASGPPAEDSPSPDEALREETSRQHAEITEGYDEPDGTHRHTNGRASPPLVPAPPSKPLPVPHPRRAKKPVLVRQDGLEGCVQEGVAEGHPRGSEAGDAEGSPGFAAPSLRSDVGEPESPVESERPPEPEPDLRSADEEPGAPVPPPRQTSLSHRHKASSLQRHACHSADLLSGPEPRAPATGEEGRAADDKEDGYGEFERYPIAHSLPKQIKLGCQRPALGGRKALSAEGQDSPRAPPRKPQRHSLPAPPPPPISPSSAGPPAPPHAGAPTRGLPAPPHLQEKAAWRFPRPSVTFFSRQAPGRCSVPPPQGRAPPPPRRAQSFSAADLSCREAANPRRSVSFRKLLELGISVKMLPRRLSKAGGGASPDTTEPGGDAEANGGGSSGDGSVEYENVPLYEEIPEYMNLPFHGGRLGWPHDSGDSDIYEVQDPYLNALGDRYESGWMMHDDVHSEEDEVHSSDEDDNSSSSSKGHHEEVDRQEIMSSEKVFVDVLKLLHIDFRDAVAKATRQNGKPVVEERVLSQILYYLPQLYELNRDLLRELEDRVAHWADHQRLADIFVQKGPYLKMYSTYIRQFDINVALLDEQCRKNPAFTTVTSPRCASLALKHYLLKPVQRIPQYQLLLTDYLKNLPEDSEDYKDTQAALSIVKEVANHANDIMKQGDNFQKLMHIQYSLNGHQEIVQPGRVFLKEGTLMKLSTMR